MQQLVERLERATADRYSVRSEIDGGGGGTLFLADDMRLGRPVAIKVLRPNDYPGTDLHRFLREIAITARLQHPHILPLHDSGEGDGLAYYVMPFVREGSLQDRIDREGPLPLLDVQRITAEVGSALDRAHLEGIVHRDVKPANILLQGNHAAICDFGVARAGGGAGPDGLFFGTAAYASPEQATGSKVDGRADQYGMACTVFEMLTGETPYSGSPQKLMLQHVTADVPSVRDRRPDLPVHVERAIRRAMSKEPGDRFATLLEFANALGRDERSAEASEMSQGPAASEGSLFGRLRSALAGSGRAAESAGAEAGGRRCPSCDRPNPAAARFCNGCGHAFDAQTSPSASPSDGQTPLPESGLEIRQLTILTGELTGADELTARLDPEEAFEWVEAYRTLYREAVERYDGQVVLSSESGFTAYFGYPVAHEDDPVRAGLAGLEILRVSRQLAEDIGGRHGTRLAIKMGMHTGRAVLGEEPDGSLRSAVGATPLVAGQLRDRAGEGVFLASRFSHRLFKGHFACQEVVDEGPHPKDEPVSYRVLAESGSGRLVTTPAPSAAPPLVGRETELRYVLDAWDEAAAGASRMVLISGEAGIGKSRLMAAAREHLASAPHLLLRTACSRYRTNTPLHGVVGLIEDWFGIVPEDSGAERLKRVRQGVARHASEPGEEDTAMLADLLRIDPADGYTPLGWDPAHRRARTLELVLEMVSRAASKLPVVLTIDDLQWADPSTLAFLSMWIERCRDLPMLILATVRPEFTSPWAEDHVRTLELDGLPEAAVADVILGVTDGVPVAESVVDQIVRRADGVPLFIRETTLALIESGALVDSGGRLVASESMSSATVPTTLRDALTARIDRLGRAKALVQMGAVIGREFSVALLGEVAELDDWLLLNGELGRGVDAGILDQRGSGATSVYAFRHALVQENAYQSLPRAARREYHHRVVDALAARFPHEVKANPGRMAYHCTEAGEGSRSLPYWIAASWQALAGAALTEAIEFARSGLGVLDAVADGDERNRAELELQRALAHALQGREGYTAEGANTAYARARQLCRSSGSPERSVATLFGHHTFHSVGGDLRSSLEVAEEMLEIAEASGAPVNFHVAHLSMALSKMFLGHLLEAREHFLLSLDHYREEDWPRKQDYFADELRSIVHAYHGRNLWLLGERDAALESSGIAVSIADGIGEAQARASARGMQALQYMIREDVESASRWADETVDVAAHYGLKYWHLIGALVQAWVKGRRGEFGEAIPIFEHLLGLYQQQGARLGLSWLWALLAEMYADAGDLDRADGLIGQALQQIETTGEHYVEPEVRRMSVDFRLRRPAPDLEAAERGLRRALQVAEASSALSFELRISVDLARLLHEQGRSEEAVPLLEVVRRFPDERTRSADLGRADEVLAALT